MPFTSKDVFELFKKDYEIGVSFEEIEKKSSSVSADILEGNVKTAATQKYARLLCSAFDAFVVGYIKPEEYKEGKDPTRGYDLSLKSERFIKNFETLMRVRFEEKPKNAGKERKAMEGLSMNDLKKALQNHVRKYGTVSDVWAENIKSGTYNMDELKKVTDEAYKWAQEHDKSALSRLETVENADEATEKVVVTGFEATANAYEAMKKIVASRSGWWRFWIWNWNQDKKEQEYLKQLEAQVKEINEKFDNVIDNVIAERKAVPISDFAQELEWEMQDEMAAALDEKIERFEENLKTKFEKEEERKRDEELEREMQEELKKEEEERKEKLRQEEEEKAQKEQEKQDKIARGLSLEVKFEEITSAGNFKEEMMDELIKDIPEIAGVTKEIQKKFFDNPFDSILMKSVQEELAKFTAEGVDKQAQMREMAKAIFVTSGKVAEKIGYLANPTERLAVAQIMTDKIMSKLSPAAMEPDKYTAVEKGYFLAHPVTTNEFVPNGYKLGEEFLNDSYAKANKTYGELTGNAQEIQEFVEVKQPEPKVEVEEELEGYEDRTDNVYFIDEEGDVSYDPFRNGESIFVPNLSNAFEVGDPDSYAVHEEVVEGDEEEIEEVEEVAEEKVEEEQPAPVEEKEVPISEKLGAILNQENFTEMFADGLAQKLPSGIDLTHENKNIEDAKKRLLNAKSLKTLGEKLDGLNKKFDEGKEAGKDVKALMQEYMKGVIPEAKELMSGMTIKGAVYRLAFVQLTVDYMVQNYSPAVHLEALQEFKLGAMFRSEELLNLSLNYSPAKIAEYAEKVKPDYDKLVASEVVAVPNGNEEKEKVFGEDNPFVEDGGKIAPQVSQEPKQNVPTLNNGNK